MNEKLEGLKKVLEVFSKEYKEETKYREFMEQNIDKMKFSDYDFESPDDMVKRINKRKINIRMEESIYD